LVRAGRPLEFFIEGMRSRGGRTLAPKMGFLKMVTDSFFEPQAEVDDVVVLPLSITYDRLLEHDLYARELLGIPKPPENVANLLRSVTILGNNYGAVNLRFGAVLSLRDTAERFNGSVEKARVAALAKGTQAFTPGDLLEDFAGAITRRLDERTVVTPSALVSAALLFLNDTRLLSSGAGVPLETLTGQIESLRDAALRCGATMSDRFHDATAGALFEYARPLLAPHVRVRDGLVRVGPDATSSFMVHAIYANQLAYLLAPVGVLAVAAASEPEDAAALRARAQGGLKTLAVEFPSFLGLEKHRDPFAEGVDLLRRADGDRAATTTEGKITVARGPFGTAGARLVNATVESYYVAALVCAALAGKPEVQEKSLLKVARSAALDLYAAELLDFPQCANQETLRNGLAAARQHGVLKTTGAVGVVVAESTPDAALGYAAQLALWRRSAATPEQMQQAVKIVQDIAARASTVSAKL
jgi:glycerol-3-phosphate O-acyltransferase